VSGDAENRLEELRAEARFARQRLDLYRARAYGSRPTSPAKLRELEQEATRTQERLEHMQRMLAVKADAEAAKAKTKEP
jgi:hypothetical protein